MSGGVLIMAGGTGGHVFPALAVADELRRRDIRVSWLGTRRGLEARVVPNANIDIDWIDVQGVRGKGGWSRLVAVAAMARALGQALRVVARRRPAVVLGMGGFVSGPGGIAAWLLRKPLVIHEQNSVAGLTNRILARFAKRVLCAFPGAFAGRDDVEIVGNPLRAGFLANQPEESNASVESAIANDDTVRRVLVIGGSQGAMTLNQRVPEALAQLASALPDQLSLSVRHQCGERHVDAARAAYVEAGVDAEVVAFVDDMPGAYRWADVVICRAGALTVSEIAASGVAAVFVPFPFAVDDHQTGNARFLVDAGAALVLSEREPDAAALVPRLRDALNELLTQPARLREMASNAGRVARPQATINVSDVCGTFATGGAA